MMNPTPKVRHFWGVFAKYAEQKCVGVMMVSIFMVYGDGFGRGFLMVF